MDTRPSDDRFASAAVAGRYYPEQCGADVPRTANSTEWSECPSTYQHSWSSGISRFVVGQNTVLHFALRYSERSCFLLEMMATAMGLGILLYALRYAPVGLKLFVVFSFSILVLSLARPLAGAPSQPQWEWLRFPGTSNRYFFMPILAFLAALLWIADSARHRAMRVCSVRLLLCVCVGIRRDWRYPAFEDMHFREYASQFQTAPTGTKIH